MTLLLIAFGLVAPRTVIAGSATWTSILEFVEEDNDHDLFVGGTPGSSVFSGQFDWGDTCNGCPTRIDDGFDENNPGVQYFPTDSNGIPTGGATLTALGVTVDSLFGAVSVYNDVFVDGLAASFFNSILGFSVSPGQSIDLWCMGGNNQTLEGILFNESAEWLVCYVYWTTSPLTSNAFAPAPPPGNDGLFSLLDGADGTYLGWGSQVTVPEPGLAFGLFTGTLILARLRRRPTPGGSPRRAQ